MTYLCRDAFKRHLSAFSRVANLGIEGPLDLILLAGSWCVSPSTPPTVCTGGGGGHASWMPIMWLYVDGSAKSKHVLNFTLNVDFSSIQSAPTLTLSVAAMCLWLVCVCGGSPCLYVPERNLQGLLRSKALKKSGPKKIWVSNYTYIDYLI